MEVDEKANPKPKPPMLIKLMVNKRKRRVMYAEAGKEFADVLVSILTLPIGYIVKIAFRNDPSANTTCITNIYNSVEVLPDFLTISDNSILLDPKVVSTSYISEILNIQNHPPPPNPAESPKYYGCSNSFRSSLYHHTISRQSETVKCACGSMVNREVSFVAESPGYFKRDANFVITDDLRFIPVTSTATVINLWNKIGVRESTELEEQNITVGAKEVIGLLKAALFSNTALSNVFKAEQTTSQVNLSTKPSLAIKLMINKRNREVMYAEAGKEFLDLLVSFLTLPVGSIVKLALLNDPSANNTCITNLYNSIEILPDFFMKSDKSILLDPKVVSNIYTSEILHIQDPPPPTPSKPAKTLKYYECNDPSIICLHNHNISTEYGIFCLCGSKLSREVNFVDPTPELVAETGYFKKNAIFVIKDDLGLIPMNSTATIVNLWNKSGIREPTELEEWNFSVGANEVIGLFKAAMFSNTALNDVFKAEMNYSAKVSQPAMDSDLARVALEQLWRPRSVG